MSLFVRTEVLSTIFTQFHGREQTKAMSLYAAAFPLGGILGPILGAQLSEWSLLAPAITLGLEMGAALNSLFGAYMTHTRPEQAGSASEVMNTTVQAGTATGIALFGTLYFSYLSHGSATATLRSLLAAAALLVVALALAPALPKPASASVRARAGEPARARTGEPDSRRVR